MKRLIAPLLLCAFAPAFAQVPITAAPDQAALLKDRNSQLAANKKLVFDFWRTVIAAGHVDQAEKFMAEDYIQHNPAIPTGRASLVKMMGGMPPRPVQSTIPNLVSVVADGDLVVLGVRFELTDAGKKYTTMSFDMFRVKGGKVVEHWDDVRLGAGGPPPGPGGPGGPPGGPPRN